MVSNEKYVCKECNVECDYVGGVVTRKCEHSGTITLLMETNVYGEGGMNA